MDVVQERDQTNAVKTTYVRAGNIGGLLTKTKRPAGQPDIHLFFHYDGQGNVVQLTNATQATVATYKYDAFGNNTGITGAEAGDNLFRFSTKEFQTWSGLYNYGLRFYSPSLGRFITRDPSAEAGGLNLYAAFANNPLTYVDEYGLSIATFMQGFWEGVSQGGLAALVVAGATAALMASGSCAVIAATVALTRLSGAVGAIALIQEINELVNGNLCPDERDRRIGQLLGGFIAGMVGAKLAPKFTPKKVPPTCFVAGTLVLMADGTLKPIEQIEKGEQVMARDEETGQTEAREVTYKKVRHASETLLLSFSNGTRVETTKEHPFYVEHKGFTPAGELGIGTSIVTRAGPTLQITGVEIKTEGATVYNFGVEGLHTYFVGNSRLWVPNADCGTHGKSFCSHGCLN